MAGTPKYVHPGALPMSLAIIDTINRLVDDVELVRAAVVAIATRLDADAGVTGTTFVSADCAPINPATDLTAFKLIDH